MVKAKCTTWSQKKALLQLIEQEFVEQIIDPVDDLLMRGQVVPSDLQHYYDNVLVEISEKQQFVKQAMHQQVDIGNLTEYELNFLLEQVEHRIQTLSAKSTNKANNNPALTKARERRDMLKAFTPVAMPKLQHHAALGKLWKQLYALSIPLDLDGNSGRLLSVQESKLVGKRDDLLQEIEQLEYASQGWLEDDEIFEWRLNECRNEFEQRFASSKRSGKTRPGASYSGVTSNLGSNRSSSSRKPITKWITPADKKGPTVAKKKNKLKKQDLFSAMMAASSSEEEDSDDDGNNQEQGSWKQAGTNSGVTSTVSQKSTNKAKQAQSQSAQKKSVESSQVEEKTQEQQVTSASSSKKKRNRKKKKGKASNSNDVNENEQGKSSELESSQSSVASQSIPMIILHVLMAILHIIMAILTWLISLVLGSKKKGKKKKRS